MKSVIVGAGRIGLAMADAAKAAGHQVVLLVREHRCERASDQGFDTAVSLEPSDWESVDLVVLAVAVEDRLKYTSDREVTKNLAWLKALPPDLPVASIAASPANAKLSTLVGNRPTVRFRCTPAVGDPASLRFYEGGGPPQAAQAIRGLLPSPEWFAVEPHRFRRLSALIVAPALMCAALASFEQHLGWRLTVEDRRFLSESILEAYRLMESNAGDARAALASTATPGGMTRRFSEQVFGSDSVARLLDPEDGRST